MLAQNELNQFEKTEAEIIKFINSPDMTFNLGTDTGPMDAKVIADIVLELKKDKPNHRNILTGHAIGSRFFSCFYRSYGRSTYGRCAMGIFEKHAFL